MSTDSSGIPRYVPMIFEIPDGVAPSFALAVVSAAVGADPVFGPDRIELAGRTTKTDLGYHLPIRYYGPAGSFRRYSAAKLLRGDVDAESLRGQVVVVGMTAAGLGDTFATPFDRVAPGVEIFATAISNLLSGDTLARTPSTRRIDAAMAAGLPVAMIALIAMRRAAVGLALAALVFVFWAAGVFLAFVNGYWLSAAWTGSGCPEPSVVPRGSPGTFLQAAGTFQRPNRFSARPMLRHATVSEEDNHARFCWSAVRNRFHWWTGQRCSCRVQGLARGSFGARL